MASDPDDHQERGSIHIFNLQYGKGEERKEEKWLEFLPEVHTILHII